MPLGGGSKRILLLITAEIVDFSFFIKTKSNGICGFFLPSSVFVDMAGHGSSRTMGPFLSLSLSFWWPCPYVSGKLLAYAACPRMSICNFPSHVQK